MSDDDAEQTEQTTDAGEVIPIPTIGQVMGDLGHIARVPPRRITMTPRIERHEVIMAWLAAHVADPAACTAMTTWTMAVLSGGAQVANGGFINAVGDTPPFHYAVVPGTGAMVVFYERWTVPVRMITFVAVIDAP